MWYNHCSWFRGVCLSVGRVVRVAVIKEIMGMEEDKGKRNGL
jgi:hypothetical protein